LQRIPFFQCNPPAALLLPFLLANMLVKRNPREKYSFVHKIAKGGFSTVYTAKNRLNKREMVAVKILSEKFEKDYGIVNEVFVLPSCRHPNIISHLESFLWNNEIYVVTEYADAGTLEKMAQANLTEGVMAYIIGEVLKGLVYLHSENRIHLDVKCANILLDWNGRVKIADFGLCEEVHEQIPGKMAGSKYWMSPEIISKQPYDTKVDIWSIGVLGFALANKSPPYGDCHLIKAMYLVGTQGVFLPNLMKTTTHWTHHFKDFLSLCLQLDPQKRPTAQQLLLHPWIKNQVPVLIL